MAWECRVQERMDRLRRVYKVWVVDGDMERWMVLDPQGVVHSLAPEVEADEAWAWTLPASAAHSLFAELGRALGAVESPVALRKDYDAERARVDRLIGAMLAGPSDGR